MRPMRASEPVTVSPSPQPDMVGEERKGTFEGFFDSEHRGLFGALVLITGNRHDAEELMQDAFLKLLERWDRVAGMDDPTGYLYRTAMNLWRSRVRRVRVALARSVRPAPAVDELAAVEENQAAMQALAPLTPRQRAAVVLVDVLGLTSEEAAGSLGIKASTVRVLLARGRDVLRKEWTDHG